MDKQFTEGTLVRISLTNFMTYADVTFVPGPMLNLVIGPNGSGKSSLSCAMVLGLAGNTKILGRAPKVSQFVKRGCDVGVIETELYRPNNNNVVIKRTMTLADKTTWEINNNKVSLQQVQDLMEELRIQVDNLCQFLPQDRVHDFAKMNKQELLENTQKSVGSAKLYDMFLKIKDCKKDDASYSKNITDINSQIASARDNLSRLEPDVLREQNKRSMIQDIDNMKKKKSWINYNEKKERLDFICGQKKKKQLEVANSEKEVEPFKIAFKESEKNFKICEDRFTQLSLDARKRYGEGKTIRDEVNHCHDKVVVIKERLQKTLEADDRRAEEIEKKQLEIDGVNNNINSVNENELVEKIEIIQKNVEGISENLVKVTNDHHESMFSVKEIKNQLRVVSEKIEKGNNILNTKIQFLRTKDPAAYKVRDFCQKNKHLFTGEIYGPIFVEINITNLKYAKYIEAVIPFRDRTAFVCEANEDMKKLVDICRTQMDLPLAVFKAPPNAGLAKEMFRPAIPVNTIRKYGLLHYLQELVEGPEAVLRVLCNQHHLHQIPFGTKDAYDNQQNIQNLGIRRFFSDEFQVIFNQSKYTKQTSMRSRPVRPASMFIHHANSDPSLQTRANDLDRQLREKTLVLEGFEQKRQECEIKRNKLLEEIKLLKGKRDQFNYMVKRKELLKKEYSQLINSRINKEAERQKTEALIKEEIKKSVGLLGNLLNKASENQGKVIESALYNLNMRLLKFEIEKKNDLYKEACKQTESVKNQLAECEKKYYLLKEEADKAYKEAAKQTENLSPKDPAFKERFHDKFKSLPNSLDEINQKIDDFEARAECLGTNEKAIVEDQKIRKRIEELENELKCRMENFTHLKQQLDGLKSQWLPEITRLVRIINNTYSKVFERMGGAGEVSLTHGDDKDDLLKYGLTIKVKFRKQDDLQELDIFRQSGGERAVSIAMYMLSLQELTHVPFRCVDEINQGMDEQNERRVFNLLVETVKKSNVSQYFLLTPKLLANLDYGENVQVHIIMNGNGALTNEKWLIVDQHLKSLDSSSSSSSEREKRKSMKRKYNGLDTEWRKRGLQMRSTNHV